MSETTHEHTYDLMAVYRNENEYHSAFELRVRTELDSDTLKTTLRELAQEYRGILAEEGEQLNPLTSGDVLELAETDDGFRALLDGNGIHLVPFEIFPVLLDEEEYWTD